jgi:hypothetical protein
MSIRSRTCLFDHDIASMSKAFETASTRLGLVDRNDPPTIAVEIIELAKNGERDPTGCVPWRCLFGTFYRVVG